MQKGKSCEFYIIKCTYHLEGHQPFRTPLSTYLPQSTNKWLLLQDQHLISYAQIIELTV